MASPQSIRVVRSLAFLLALGLLAAVVGCASRPSADTDQGPMPRISGAFGQRPVVDIPAGEPSDRPVFRVLSEGEGEPVSTGDAVVAHVGITVWNDERPYLNTYDAKQPTTISLDGQTVAESWEAALVGKPAGSRVLLVAPARQGFGADGMPPAQLRPSDTLVVVFDILGGYEPNAGADGEHSRVARTGTEVSGDPGTEPSIELPKGAEPSRRTRVTELVEGTGKPVAQGEIAVLQYSAYSVEAGAVVDSSYRRNAPNGFTLEPGLVPPGWLEALDGARTGSRLLVEVPESETRDLQPTPGGLATPTGTDLVYVLDVVDAVDVP